MPRLLIITEVVYPESTMLNDFIEEVVKHNFYVEVIARHPSYPAGKVYTGYQNTKYSVDYWNEIKIHRMHVVEGYKDSKLKKIRNYLEFIRLGNKIARRIGQDFDHVLVYQTGPLTVALPGVTIKKRFGIPLTVWTCDIWPDAVYAYGLPRIFPLTTFLNRLIRRVYQNSNNILVSSQQFSHTISNYVSDKVIHYTPNWLVSQDRVASEIKLDVNKFNLTFTGNVSISQNLENVIRGWNKSNLFKRATLNIVGDGSSLESLKSLVEKQNIKGIVFHGRYPGNQIFSILNQSDMLLLPLISDPGIMKTEPFKLQSYLEAGKPIFGVIDGAGREIIEDNQLGICANPDDITCIADGFSEAINFALEHKNSIDQKAQVLLDTRFNREKTIFKIINVISS